MQIGLNYRILYPNFSIGCIYIVPVYRHGHKLSTNRKRYFNLIMHKFVYLLFPLLYFNLTIYYHSKYGK